MLLEGLQSAYVADNSPVHVDRFGPSAAEMRLVDRRHPDSTAAGPSIALVTANSSVLSYPFQLSATLLVLML